MLNTIGLRCQSHRHILIVGMQGQQTRRTKPPKERSRCAKRQVAYPMGMKIILHRPIGPCDPVPIRPCDPVPIRPCQSEGQMSQTSLLPVMTLQRLISPAHLAAVWFEYPEGAMQSEAVQTKRRLPPTIAMSLLVD
jgi:hypothetical protein